MQNVVKTILVTLITLACGQAFSASYDSIGSGDWSTTSNWSISDNPDVGGWGTVDGFDSVTISGDAITANAGTYGTGNSRFNVSNGNTVTINGGGSLTLSGSPTYLIGAGNSVALTGTMNIESGTLNAPGSTALGHSGGHGVLLVGDGSGAAGDATYNGSGNLLLGNGTGTLVVESDGQLINTRLALGNTASTTSTVTINGGGLISTTPSASPNYFAQATGSVSSMTLNGSSSFVFNNTDGNNGAVQVGTSGTATITLNDTSSILGTASHGTSYAGMTLGWNNTGAGTLILNDNSSFSADTSLLLGRSGTGTVVQNGGSVQTSKDLFFGRFGTGAGTYNLVSGTVTVGSQIRIAYDGTGVLNQTGGTVNARTIIMGENSASSSGSYFLLGGTLRADSISTGPGSGSFDWQAGTLNSFTPVNAEGSVNWAQTGLGFIQTGNIIDFNGSLSTGAGSTLDLDSVYLNGSVRVNRLDVYGDLDLSGVGDTLILDGSVNFLRPFSLIGADDYGSIPLVQVIGGNLTGTFDNFLAPANDSKGWAESSFAVSDASLLDLNTWYLEYDEVNDTIWFHYRTTGTVPEPDSFAMILVGTGFLYSLRKKGRRS